MIQLIRNLINVFVTIVSLGLNKLCELLKRKCIDKIINIAIYVENIHSDEIGSYKKEIFLRICEKADIKVKFADYYLEKYIIPITKVINNYSFRKQDNNRNYIV